jgi:hypothetical protein
MKAFSEKKAIEGLVEKCIYVFLVYFSWTFCTSKVESKLSKYNPKNCQVMMKNAAKIGWEQWRTMNQPC